MYSNRYVALHCCQEKYISEIELNGIVRDTKAVFICDIEKIDSSELYNTLAVLIYHGIGVCGWKKFLEEKEKLNKIDKNLVIVMARISKKQEDIIKKNNILNYYKICNRNGRTMNYYKIKDIGKIKKIVIIERIPLYNTCIQNFRNVDPIKDRFFIKNTYDNLEVKENKAVGEIKEICYKIANKNLKLIKKDIEKIMDLNERY